MIDGTGLRLKVLRTQNNLSLRQVKERTGIALATVSSYENGDRTPTGDNLMKLATLYRASTDYILMLDDRPVVTLDPDLSENQVIRIRNLIETAIDLAKDKETVSK